MAFATLIPGVGSALLLGLPQVCLAAPPTEAGFSDEMRPRIVAEMHGSTLSFDPADPLTLMAKGGDRNDLTINLHRIHAFCQRAEAKACDAAKAAFIASIVDEPAKPTAAALRLIVRDAQYRNHIASLHSPGAKNGMQPVHEQIGDDLFAFLASDSPNQIALVNPDTLKDLGLSREEAWGIALRQTKARLPKLPTIDQLREGAVGFEADEYLASLLIDREGWALLAAAMGPDLFVSAVSDQFVFAGMLADGAKFDDFLGSVAEDCASAERCVSPNVYRFRDGRWTVAGNGKAKPAAGRPVANCSSDL